MCDVRNILNFLLEMTALLECVDHLLQFSIDACLLL